MIPPVTLTADMPIQIGGEFAIRLRQRGGDRIVVVRSIPREIFVDAHERQCQRNHGGQTLERIRERGGLGASEAFAVLSCIEWTDDWKLSAEIAHRALYGWIATFRRGGLVERKAAA